MNAPRAPQETDAVEALARTLDDLVDRVRNARAEAEALADATPAVKIDHALGTYARALYRSRRLRDRVLEPERLMLGEPLWDMLLDLFIHDSIGQPVSASSLVIAGAVAPTTGLRYVDRLIGHRLATGAPDPSDARRRLLRLTDHGRSLMTDCLAQMLATEEKGLS